MVYDTIGLQNDDANEVAILVLWICSGVSEQPFVIPTNTREISKKHFSDVRYIKSTIHPKNILSCRVDNADEACVVIDPNNADEACGVIDLNVSVTNVDEGLAWVLLLLVYYLCY